MKIFPNFSLFNCPSLANAIRHTFSCVQLTLMSGIKQFLQRSLKVNKGQPKHFFSTITEKRKKQNDILAVQREIRWRLGEVCYLPKTWLHKDNLTQSTTQKKVRQRRSTNKYLASLFPSEKESVTSDQATVEPASNLDLKLPSDSKPTVYDRENFHRSFRKYFLILVRQNNVVIKAE